MSESFILMHISDPHFYKLPRNPFHYASKRAFGALNLVLNRRLAHPWSRFELLMDSLRNLRWDHLLITGDLTQLGTDGEFALAREVLSPLLERGKDRVTVIPGNHDRYTRDAPRRRRFEFYFGDWSGAHDGDRQEPGGLLTRRLTERWWMAGWDSAMPAGIFSATGEVSQQTLAATSRWLTGLPAGARVIIANHYPVFFPPPHRYKPHHDLRNQEEVERWLLSHPVHLYLHGHVHQNWIMTVAGEHGPLTVVNSASSTRVPRLGDPSAFHRIVLEEERFRIEPIKLE